MYLTVKTPTISSVAFYKPTRTNLFCAKADIPLEEVFRSITTAKMQECTGNVTSLNAFDLFGGISMNRYFYIVDNGLLPLFVRSLSVIAPHIRFVSSDKDSMPMIIISDVVYRLVSVPRQYTAIVNILLSAIHASNGVLLIEDLECGLHHTLYEPLMSALDVISKECNVQVFATTQSAELIKAANIVHNKSNSYELTYYRLDRASNGDIETVHCGEQILRAAIEFGFELR